LKEFHELTEEEKVLFLENTFYYEVDMLINAYLRLLQIQIVNNDLEMFIALESFLLHGRNLYEFYFFQKRGVKDNARVYDYISHEKSNIIKSNTYLIEYEFKDKSNKQLAHLNYTRLEYENNEKKPWEIQKIMKEFICITKYFIGELSGDFRGNNILILNNKLNNNPYLKILKDKHF
jgi:hypothetical protein